MNWHAFGVFLLTNLVLSLTPGPAVLLVTGHAAANGWQRAQASVLGIMSGNTIYCLLSALGLGVLFMKAPMLVSAVKIIGAAYLAFIAIRALLSANKPLILQEARPAAPARVLYRQALVLQLSNPKSVLFFCALLPQFMSGGDTVLPMLALGFAAIVLEYPVLTAYSLLGSQVRRMARSRYAVHSLNVLSASLLLLAAGRVGMM